jgi:hypothetical protein
MAQITIFEGTNGADYIMFFYLVLCGANYINIFFFRLFLAQITYVSMIN